MKYKPIAQIFIALFLMINSFGGVAYGQSANYEFYKQQQQFLNRNRTKAEKANPFKNPDLFQDTNEVETFISQISSDRFSYKHDRELNEVHIFDKTKNDELAAIIPLTTRADVLSFRPSKFKERLGKMTSDIYRAGKGGVVHTAVNLPMEVSIFYMAIGSVAAANLFSNAGKNPAALKMFNDQQSSFVGVTSLFMFLASQNATSNVAQLFIKNPKWQTMLPYLGMTVGSMAQNYTTSLMTDPNIKACVNEWFGPIANSDGASENPCDKAYEYFTLQKPWEFAPGLTSMIASTIVATTVQYGAAKGLIAVEKKITNQIIRNEVRRELTKTVLLRFAGFVNPGAVPYLAVSGVWLYLTKASNLAFFAALDHKMSQQITFGIKNLQESVALPFVNSIKKTSDNLTQTILIQKQNDWAIPRTEESCQKNRNADCSGLYEELVRFQDQMKIWRMANIAEVTESHHSWQTYLGDLVARFSAAREFYQRFVNEAKKYGGKISEENYLERVYPLWGIKTTKTKFFDETFFTDPHLPESEQLQLALVAKEGILKIFEDRKQRARTISGAELEFYNILHKNFKGNDGNTLEGKQRLGTGFIAVKAWLVQQEVHGKNKYSDYTEVAKIIDGLGGINPKLEKGIGFISAISRAPRVNDLFKQVDLDRDKTLSSTFNPNSYADVLLRNMICGPDSENNENLIDQTWGFSAHFTSPRITNFLSQVPDADSFCDHRFPKSLFATQNGSTFTGPFKFNKKQPVAAYHSPFEFLKFNLKENVYKQEFSDWWATNTESQVSAAFGEFQKKYVANIAKLIEKISQVENSDWNTSNTVANGLMINIFQELRIYLLVLGEVAKDHLIKQNKLNELSLMMDMKTSLSAAPLKLTSAEKSVDTPEMVKYQARGSFLDFSNMYEQVNKPIQKDSKNVKVLLFQSEMEKYFSQLNGILQRLKVSKDTSGQVIIQGEADGAEMDKVIEKIEDLAKRIAIDFGVSKSNADETSADQNLVFPTFNKSNEGDKSKLKSEAKIILNDSTKLVVVKVLELIQALSYEIKAYAMITNAVNWKYLNNLKVNSEAEEKRKQKINQIIKKVQNVTAAGG